MKVDTVFENARFWTGDGTYPTAHSVAVHHGRIVAIDDEDVQAHSTVDLDGRRVLPGLHDAHNHLAIVGVRLASADLRPGKVNSLDELYRTIEAHALAVPEGEWIKAAGYDQNFLGGQHPTAEGLDRVTGNRPCIVEHVSGHMVVVNTKAFELAGYADRFGFPDIDGGRVVRDGSGRPDGLLQETAMTPMRTLASHVSDAEIARTLTLAGNQASEYGLTSITEPGVVVDGTLERGGAAVHHYLNAVQNGLLRQRMVIMPFHDELHALDRGAPATQSLDWGIRTGLGDDRLRIGPVKIVSDGSLIGRSAAVHTCYCGEPDNQGVLQVEPDDLKDLVASYHRAGWTVATHAIGDRAIDNVLDAIEHAQSVLPRRVRHRIEHFAIATDEQVRRCAGLGVVPVPQGVFISDFGDGILDAIGEQRSRGTYRMRSLLDAGMTVPGSTDAPVSDANPLVSIHDMVNRVTSGGQVFAGHERVTVEEALTAYTYGSAYAAGVETHRGRIVEGQAADFTVLNEDILTIDRSGIRDVTVDATIIGGEIAFERAA